MKKSKGFTLAEVVITIIVIGVVSAITIPMLSNDVNDKKWNVARQKAKATIGEAFRLMTINGEITTNKTTAQFVEDIIPQYLKIEKTCTPANYKDCGFPSTVKTPGGQTVGVAPNDYKWSELSNSNVWKNSPTSADSWSTSNLDTFKNKYGAYDTSYYFRTLDGFSVAFLYNPYCVGNTRERYTLYYTVSVAGPYYYQQSMDVVCLMGIYDMNGKSGPNKVGMDIGFVGSFYNSFETKSAAVLPHSVEKQTRGNQDNWLPLANYCENLGKNNDWIMPDLDELSLLYLNYRLTGNGRDKYVEKRFFSRSPVAGDSSHIHAVSFRTDAGGSRDWRPRSYNYYDGAYVRCVRNTALK